MSKFRCPYGHTEVIKGQLAPMIHESRSRCTIYVQLRRERKVDVFGRPVGGSDIASYMLQRPSPPSPTDAPAPSVAPPGAEPTGAGGAATSAESSLPSDRPEKEPLSKRLVGGLGIKYREVSVTAPGTVGAPVQDADWLASEETTERFWEVIFGFIEQGVNLLCGFLEIPVVPKEVFEIDAGQSFVFRTALRPFTTNVLKKVFGAKSPEDADRIVAGLSGLLGFGMVIAKVTFHFLIHIPKSPRLARRKANRERAEAERRSARERGDGPSAGGTSLVLPPRAGAPA